MSKQDILKELGENSDRTFCCFSDPSYDTAIIGITDDDRVVYSFNKMVEYLMVEEQMTQDDAIDFICYNTIRSLSYYDNNTPIIVQMEELFM